MKNKYIPLFLLIVFLLSSCSGDSKTEIWEDGYNAGYSDGKFDSDTEHEDDYTRGYEDGFNDAASDYDRYPLGGRSNKLTSLLLDIEHEARFYANSNSDFDLESALDTVDSYLTGTADAFGEYPTKAEFEEAARYLYDFSDFYYNRRYYD